MSNQMQDYLNHIREIIGGLKDEIAKDDALAQQYLTPVGQATRQGYYGA